MEVCIDTLDQKERKHATILNEQEGKKKETKQNETGHVPKTQWRSCVFKMTTFVQTNRFKLNWMKEKPLWSGKKKTIERQTNSAPK